MATPNSRGSARGPAVPRSASVSTLDRVAFSVEPKSDYLRSALEARRAKDTPSTPSPTQSRPLPQRSASTTIVSADPWIEQAASEEDNIQPPVTRRGRRPSESALPRMPTAREQQVENEKLRSELFNSKMKLELLAKQNSEWKDKLDDAERRIEELEPLEEENIDLREANDHLTLKVHHMDEEIVQLQDANAELLQIQEEAIGGMEKHQTALEEAADVIIRLEKEKAELQAHMAQMKEELNSNKSSVDGSEQFHDNFDGQPARVHSIDESRPSTSHFDSDYYSQSEASPQVRPRRINDSASYAERAQDYLAKSRRSVCDLKQRSSDASMKTAAMPRG